jgi:hypothetical protein
MAGDGSDQDDVPIHTRRQSRLGNAPRYSGYAAGGNQGYDVDAYMAPAAQTRQSSYGGGGYTDSPHMQERYNNPFEQPSPQQVDFDVMADFNNAGPRYSNLYGKGTDESMRELVKSGGRPITYVPSLHEHYDFKLTFTQIISSADSPLGAIKTLPPTINPRPGPRRRRISNRTFLLYPPLHTRPYKQTLPQTVSSRETPSRRCGLG